MIGPTATVLLDNLATNDGVTSDWHVTTDGVASPDGEAKIRPYPNQFNAVLKIGMRIMWIGMTWVLIGGLIGEPSPPTPSARTR